MPDVATIRSVWSELDPTARTLTIALIASLTVSAWGYMWYMAWAMGNMHLVDMWMPPQAGVREWIVYDFMMLFMMWIVMMLAMMLPSVTPFAMLFAKVQQQRKRSNQIVVPVYTLLTGYIISWGIYSVIATLVQWQLHKTTLLSPMMDSRSYLLSGTMLTIAGIYQWTPWKDVCLRYCRTPMNFLLGSWREGTYGAFIMGIHYGVYCVLCCWALMLIMFAVGVMNMLWMVVIAIFILVEKTVFPPRIGSAIIGTGLLVWGGWWLSLYLW